MKYDFIQSEVDALKQIIDIALRASGINLAQIALHLMGKLNNPLKEEENGNKRI